MNKFKTALPLAVLLCALLGLPSPVSADPQNDDSSSLDPNNLSTPNKIDAESKQGFALPAHQPKVIVALGGGGFKDVAQIGVLRSLEKHNIHIDGIVGTSMGALVGSLYCSGHSLDEIEKMFLDSTIQKAFNEHLLLKTALRPLAHLSYFFKARPYGGLTDAKKCSRFLEKNLPGSFNDLNIPFAAVATDLTDGRTRVLGSCELPKAVLASLAVPPLIRPVKIDGKLYVDGGIKANLPALIARQMGASTVIAVLVDASVKPVANESLRSIGAVVGRVTDIMLAANDKEQAKNSDILIYPNVDYIPLVTRDKALLEKGIAAGEAATDKLIPSIVHELASSKRERSSASNGDLR